MNFALLLLIFILVLICAILVVKLYLIKHSIKEIKNGFTDVLESDTNNIITISSSDKDIKALTINLNNNLIELRNQKLKYENGNQELKKIITNISHDLRTPLTAINGYIDLLKEEDISKTQEKYLKIVQRKSNELKELTEQLFEFSKTMDVDINIKKENCCINEILEETLISYYNIFKEKNIIPTVLICNEKIYKAINKNSLIRIFENILSNVLKYSSGDFKVELKNNGEIIFSNKATSLDATTVQKIFDRYFTVENAKRSTGLGLAIAKQLVELNSGSIEANFIKDMLTIKIKFN